MKKLLFLILTSILTMPLFAQLEVKEGSFKEVTGFVNINTEMMYDDNDRAYAVVKVKTENINDKERRQLLFEGDARTFFELEYKPGEVWVYISYYASYLKISHPDFGTTEFTFPFDMVGKKGYELTLVKKPSVDQEFADRLAKLEGALAGGTVSGEFGYLVIKTTPVDGAIVVIDGEEMAMKTPFVSEKLSVGSHRIRVDKEFYKPYVSVVNVEEGKSTNLDVELIKAMGRLEIVTYPANADIKIGVEDKGSTPKVFENMPAGIYKIELNKKKYETEIEEITVKDGETTYVEYELHKKRSAVKRGWVLIPELSLLYSKSDILGGMGHIIHIKPQLSIDYMFGPRFGCGMGFGVSVVYPQYIPLSAQVLYIINDTNLSPFINAKMGYNIGLLEKEGNFGNHLFIQGLFGELIFGLNYNKSNIGIVIGCYKSNYKKYDYGNWHIGDNSITFGLSYSYIIQTKKDR